MTAQEMDSIKKPCSVLMDVGPIENQGVGHAWSHHRPDVAKCLPFASGDEGRERERETI